MLEQAPSTYTPSHPPVDTKRLSILVVITVISFGVGVGVGMSVGGNGVAGTGDSDAQFQAGYEAARAKLKERGLIPPEMPGMGETRVLSGTVTQVNGNSVTLKVPSMDPLGDDTLYTVSMGPSTAYTTLVQKDASAYQAEVEAFQESVAASAEAGVPQAPITPPTPFANVPSNASDIAVGMQITVESADAIAGNTITASSITIPPSFERPIPDAPGGVDGEPPLSGEPYPFERPMPDGSNTVPGESPSTGEPGTAPGMPPTEPPVGIEYQ